MLNATPAVYRLLLFPMIYTASLQSRRYWLPRLCSSAREAARRADAPAELSSGHDA